MFNGRGKSSAIDDEANINPVVTYRHLLRDTGVQYVQPLLLCLSWTSFRPFASSNPLSVHFVLLLFPMGRRDLRQALKGQSRVAVWQKAVVIISPLLKDLHLGVLFILRLGIDIPFLGASWDFATKMRFTPPANKFALGLIRVRLSG